MKLTEEKRQEYLKHALNLRPVERDKIDEYAKWLPATIIDAHAHSNLSSHVIDIPSKAYNHMLSSFPGFSLDESAIIHNTLHPKTKIRSVRFPNVFKGIDHKDANRYLLDNSPADDAVALYGLPEDLPYTIEMLNHTGVSALKMYYSYLEPNAQEIYDIFKPDILAAAQEKSIPIILHTPKVITESVDDIIKLKRDYPRLKVSVAHLGSSKFIIPGLYDAFKKLAIETDIMLDTALNPSEEVCSLAIKAFGIDRIMYGSDEPLNLLRSVPYVHPDKGQRITTSQLYHWQDQEEHSEYMHLASDAVHAHWLCLDALKSAIENLPEQKRQLAKQNIFHDNAFKFFGFSKQP